MASNESVQNFVKATYKATKDGVKYLSTSTRLSAKDIKFIMDDVNNKKGTVNKTLKKIEGLEKQLKNIKKDPYNTKRIQIKNKIILWFLFWYRFGNIRNWCFL